jgi:MerR family copper efflux transcriptional regulator
VKISELAQTTGVTVDTLRYYEKQGLLNAPLRRGQRVPQPTKHAMLQRVRFVRSAQTLGFSLAQIREILPELDQGRMGRTGLEARLNAKIAEIDARFAELRALRRELVDTLASLSCEVGVPLTLATTTRCKGSRMKAAPALRHHRRPARRGHRLDDGVPLFL